MYINCECTTTEEKPEEQEKFSGKKIYESFYDILKYSNFKILKCYNLIFRRGVFQKNFGCIIIITIFSIYFICFIFFIIRRISPLKSKLKNITSKKETNNLNKNDIIISSNIKKEGKINHFQISKTKILSHPVKKIIYKTLNYIKNNVDTKRKKQIIKKKIPKINHFHETLKPYFNNNSIVINFPPSSKNVLEYPEKKIINQNIEIPNTEKKQNYDAFELNNMEYDEAICNDQRTFIQIYWDLLSREHKIIFTFFICNDYNISYIKYSRFIFLFATDMAMNVFFFSDESMHKIFLNYGKYNFIQQIPQIVYTTIISQLIEVFLCYLSLTDKYIYQIKNFTDPNIKSIMKILKCLNLKLIFFYIFTFIFFLFYWYTVTAFCSVYENTQITFLKDSLLSFLLGLLYPFVLYLIPAALRIFVLRHPKWNMKCIYKLSDIIPFF